MSGSGDAGPKAVGRKSTHLGQVDPPGVAPELDRQERALIANVLRLRGTTADDVMVPRADIIAIPVDASLASVLALIRAEGHSRFPVYREQLDDIVGMVHVRMCTPIAAARRPFAARLRTRALYVKTDYHPTSFGRYDPTRSPGG